MEATGQESVSALQDNAGQCRTMQDSAGQCRTVQDNAGQCTASAHVHKITNVPVFFIWGLDVMIFMQANPYLGRLEGVGGENLDFFGPKWHSLRS